MKPAPIALRRFAKNLRRLRQAQGFSQEDLARKALVDRTYISGCERGLRNPTITMLVKLARALGCELIDLIT